MNLEGQVWIKDRHKSEGPKLFGCQMQRSRKGFWRNEENNLS